MTISFSFRQNKMIKKKMQKKRAKMAITITRRKRKEMLNSSRNERRSEIKSTTKAHLCTIDMCVRPGFGARLSNAIDFIL